MSDAIPDGYVFRSAIPASGTVLRIAAHRDDSALADRLQQLWEGDGLPEMASALALEREQFVESGKTRCHDVAFEFAYGLGVIVEGTHLSLRDWSWCVAHTVKDVHSWIEYRGEAFDVVIGDEQNPKEFEQIAVVRPAADLRASYRAVLVECRTVLTFAGWLTSPHERNLFARYPVVSQIAAAKRKEIWESGKIGPRALP